MSQANLMTAGRSALGTVSSVFTSVGSVFGTIEDSITILHNRVQFAQTEQATKFKLLAVNSKENMLRDLSTDQSRRDLEVVKFWNEDSNNRELYEAHYAKLSAALA